MAVLVGLLALTVAVPLGLLVSPAFLALLAPAALVGAAVLGPATNESRHLERLVAETLEAVDAGHG